MVDSDLYRLPNGAWATDMFVWDNETPVTDIGVGLQAIELESTYPWFFGNTTTALRRPKRRHGGGVRSPPPCRAAYPSPRWGYRAAASSASRDQDPPPVSTSTRAIAAASRWNS
jgi:hypothetical protein